MQYEAVRVSSITPLETLNHSVNITVIEKIVFPKGQHKEN